VQTRQGWAQTMVHADAIPPEPLLVGQTLAWTPTWRAPHSGECSAGLISKFFLLFGQGTHTFNLHGALQ